MARFEPYYFYFFVIVNTLPVLVFRYFPTLDGPSHVYNSKLLLELLRGDSPLNDFVQINRITPNLVGHVILMLLQIGFSAAIAEKLFLLAYLVLFPVFFRKTILSINPKGAMVSYFVFPFVYSYLFILGFYNFIIGIVLLFWAISLWIRYQQKFTFRRSLAMFFLISLLSLSHLFVFIIFTAIVAALEFTHAISVYVINKTKWDSCMIRSYVLKFFSFSLALTISILFISMVSEAHDTWRYTPFVDLLRWIWHVQPAKAMQYVREDDYTHWLFWAIILAGIATLVSGIKKFNRMNWKNDLIRFGFDTKNVWLLAAFGLLMGFFIAPDFVGENYGYFSSRFLLFIFLTIIVWISTQKIPTWILILTFLIVNYVSLSMINLYMSESEQR